MTLEPSKLDLDAASEREAAARALRARRTLTPREVAESGGLSVEETAELLRAFGLPAPGPDEPALSEEEAHVLREMARLRDVWRPEVYLQIARVYGQALAHTAQTEVQLFRLYTERDLRERGGEEGFAEALHETLEQLLPLADPILTGVHRRWLEHELEQADVRDAELHGPAAEMPGAVDVALLFCDLKGFTAYAEAEGDAAAVEAIERFAAIVDEQRGEHGHVVKALGDGYMLSYPTASEAVSAAVRLFEHVHADGGPRLHASVHAGVAVFREGDYFGRSVNLAARLLAVARGGELLASEVVVQRTAGEFKWKHVGLEPIRGFPDPVDVWRLSGTQA